MMSLQFLLLLSATAKARMMMFAAAAVQDIVLFAGQSNVIGWPNQAGDVWENRGDDGDRSKDDEGISLENMVPILTRTIIHDTQERKQQRSDLIATIMRADESEQSIAEREADLLLEMSDNYPGIWDNIMSPVPDAYCSFLRVEGNYGIRPNTGPAHIGPNSTCGNAGGWGAELMIGRTTTMLSNFVVRKMAHGGSRIQEWRPNDPQVGIYWDKFKTNIEDMDGAHPDCGGGDDEGGADKREGGGCRYRALIWFQGISEARSDDDSYAANYTNELNNLISATREVMHAASSSSYNNNYGTATTANEIPFIMVQIGWFAIKGPNGMEVAIAQEEYCNQDPYCILVPTVDLSDFYHYEAAALLIIGERIARALDGLLLL